MSKNSEYIKEAFNIYEETLDELITSKVLKKQDELFANLIELNNEHLIDNLDKALRLFKEEDK